MAGLDNQPDPRVLAGTTGNEDAAVVRFPAGKALVQTVDFFTPIVDDPYRFGQIAAANALSDVYAMGGKPLTVMNIVCFPIKTMDADILQAILRGGLDKTREAGAAMVGGHSVDDPEIKYGLSVSGVVDEDAFASNGGLSPGDTLLLTKPMGTGVLATAFKARWEGYQNFEVVLHTWAARLNSGGGDVIQRLGLKAATDVTGFGLGGHVLEMARASGVRVRLNASAVPLMDHAYDLAAVGLVPEGSHANLRHCACALQVEHQVDPVVRDLIFDAQTSGGLVLGVPPDKVEQAQALLRGHGDIGWVVGEVLEPASSEKDESRLLLT